MRQEDIECLILKYLSGTLTDQEGQLLDELIARHGDFSIIKQRLEDPAFAAEINRRWSAVDPRKHLPRALQEVRDHEVRLSAARQ